MILLILYYCVLISLFLLLFFFYLCRSYRDKTGKNLSILEGSRPLIPLTVFVSLCLIWVKISPTNVLERDPRIFFMMSGAIFSNICVSETY